MKRQEFRVVGLELVAISAAIILLARGMSPKIILPPLGLVLIGAGFALMWISRNRRDRTQSIFNHPLMNALVYPAMIVYSFWNLWHRLR